MARGVAVGRKADHGAVAEDVELAVRELERMPEVVVPRVVAVLLHQLGRSPGLPLSSLHDEPGVGDLRVAADVIEVQDETSPDA